MAKFKVTIPFNGYIAVEVDADDSKSAYRNALARGLFQIPRDVEFQIVYATLNGPVPPLLDAARVTPND